MSAFRQRLIVRRDSRDEETFAVIEWDGVHPSELLDALRRALAEWQRTPKGRGAWEASGHDFNIGDLSGEHCQRGALAKMLARQGIRHLEIDVRSCDEPAWWTYDTHLMEAREDEAGTT